MEFSGNKRYNYSYFLYNPKLHCKFWVHGFINFHTKCSHEKVDLSPPDPYANTDLAVYIENYLYKNNL